LQRTRGVLRLRGGGLQVILGPIADGVADEIRTAMAAEGAMPQASSPTVTQPVSSGETPRLPDEQAERWLAALGGVHNVREATAVAVTRVRLRLADPASLDEGALMALGARGVQRLGEGLVHVLLGERAAGVAATLDRR